MNNNNINPQNRKLLLLEDNSNDGILTLKKILESPLGLAKEIAIRCFQEDRKENLLSYKDNLDILKSLGAGLESALAKNSYPIANYASYLFAFQQFVHSSYRARQGNFAESLLRAILGKTKIKVYTKKEHTKVIKTALGADTNSKHDLDVIANRDNEYLFVQIRSRDDTGGTTAKGSLAEFLKDVLRLKIVPKYPIRYVIFIWVSGQSQQKNSLISRIVDQLNGLTSITTDIMKDSLSSGNIINLSNNLSLELSYGFENFSKILAEFSNTDSIKKIADDTFKTLEDWDDLWLTYAIASIELQNLAIKGVNNCIVLNEKLKQLNIQITNFDVANYQEKSMEIAHKVADIWQEDTLPVSSVRDQLWYIRDLILIKMILISNEKGEKINDPKSNDTNPKSSETSDTVSNIADAKIKISFRRLVKSIPSTTYASHGMYYYPAKFIPQVVRWAIEKYTDVGDNIIDPFGGSGTVCVEALITGRNATCADLSPMLKYLVEAKTYRNPSLEDLLKKADFIIKSKEEYTPKWSNINYWYPQEIYRILTRMWGGFQSIRHPLLLIALLKTSKKFSYADDQVPKLFRSKTKIIEIERLLSSDYERSIHDYFLKCVREVFEDSMQFTRLYKGGNINVVADTDMLTYNVQGKYKLLITSPPYGQAHEYIRSVKLDLGWLGYDDNKIKELSKHEIPYNKEIPDIVINSKTFDSYIELVDGEIKNYALTYFKSVIHILDKVMARIEKGGTAAIFVGNATFSGVEFPFYKIFEEHFESKGFELELLLEDEIVGRRLFKGRNNLSPNGMDSEYLLVMRKPPFDRPMIKRTVYGTKPLF